jgi:hypothetical protein
MPSSFEQVRLKELSKRLAARVQDYEALNTQIINEVNPVTKARNQRELEELDKEIKTLQASLDELNHKKLILPDPEKKDSSDTQKRPPRTVEEYLQAATGMLGLLAGTIKAVTEAVDKFKESGVSGFGSGSVLFWLVLAVVGIILLKRGLARRSRLLDPDALELRPEREDHLFGRTQLVDEMTERLRSYRVIFVIGGVGFGKTALLRGGFMPAIARNDRFHPIYFDQWDRNDSDIPIALKEALLASLYDLPEEEREQVPKSGELEELITAIRAKLDRRLIFLFDEFHSYTQTRIHRLVATDDVGRDIPRPGEQLDGTVWPTLARLIFVQETKSCYGEDNRAWSKLPFVG